MSLQSRVSELDDYSGELTQALEKLHIEQNRGAISRDEQQDFLGDLRRAMEARKLLPLKQRGWRALVAALVLGGGACFVPPTLPKAMAVRMGLLSLAALGLLVSGWSVFRFLKAQRLGEAWLGQLDAALAKGGTIFDSQL